MSAALMEPPTPTGTTSRDSESLYEVVNGMEVEMPSMSMESIALASDLSFSQSQCRIKGTPIDARASTKPIGI